MNSRDPSEESLPDERRGEHGFLSIGSRSGLGPLTPPPALRPIPRMGAPFPERFDRDIDAIESPVTGGAGGGGGSPAPTLPFTILDASDSGPKIEVFFGTIEDIAPTDIATPIALTPDDTNTIFLECDLDSDGLITAAAIDVNTTGLPADTWDKAYKLIGTAIAVGTGVFQINQSLYFGQGFQACGRDTADPETTPGVYQFFVD